MKWSEFFTSSVGKKIVMAMTGLFLITFLVIHAGVNACIWANDGGNMFNTAAHFMGSSVVIRVLEVGLFIGFFIHIIQGLVLVFQNKKKRTSGYKISAGNNSSKWYSRSMGLLGTLILIFLLIHWWHFWIPSRFTGIASININGKEMHNLFALMQVTFNELWVVVLYVLGCFSLFWHLIHGFQSAFRTLGIHNLKFLGMINFVGIIYSSVISLAFAMMPVSMYLGWVK